MFDPVIDRLRDEIQLRVARHEVLAQNLANASTPGYKARDLRFAEELGKARAVSPTLALARTDPAHLAGGRNPLTAGEVTLRQGEGEGSDGSTVSLDAETGRVMSNASEANAFMAILARKFQGIRRALTDG